MSVNTNAGSLVWGDYLDLANDVKPWLQIPATDTSKDPLLEMLLPAGCAWVQEYLGRPVAPTRYDWRFDGWSGWNGTYVELPYYPVLEITSVVEYWGISGPHVLSESTPTEQIDGFQITWATGRLTRVFPGNVQKPWFPGSRNIEVVWWAGYNPVPPTIRLATLEWIAHWFRNTAQVRATSGTGAGTSDYSPAPPQGGLWQGVPNRIIDLLSPYVQIGVA